MRRSLTAFLAAAFLLLGSAFAAESRTFVGTAERVSDGDTLKFTVTEGSSRGSSFTVRLAGIDAPETSHRAGQVGQPMGPESTANLKRLVMGKTISLRELTRDRYGRLVGLISVDGKSVNLLQVSGGFAEVYREYLKDLPADQRAAMLEAEQAAKARRLGIWALPNYERPSEFRRRTARS